MFSILIEYIGRLCAVKLNNLRGMIPKIWVYVKYTFKNYPHTNEDKMRLHKH